VERLADKSRIIRHVFAACLFMLLLCLPATRSHAGGQTTASRLDAEITVAAPEGAAQSHGQLIDDKYTTKLSLGGNTEITVRTQEKIRGIYLVWDKPPGRWALQIQEADRTSMYLHGGNGWIHEYVELPEASSSIALVIPEAGAVLCDLSVYGSGALPEAVQVWEPPCRDADLLLLPTHADDEHLFFGGTMPYYAGELGYQVQVAYLTNHWAEPYRPHELLNGLWTVGVRAYPVIGDFPDYYSDNLDHAKTLYDPEKILAYQVELLRRFRPEVVIGHDIDGEYGHGVHMLNTWALQQAVGLAADERYLPDQVAAWGAFEVSKVYLHLYPERAIQMDWTIPLARFGGRTAFQMAEEGFSRHISQQKWFSVRNEGVHDCRAFGLYHSTVGDDDANETPDFFQNIETFSDDPEPEPPEQEMTGQGNEASATGTPIAGVFTGVLFLIVIVFLIQRRKRNKKW
jgi:LmbE family N-acetylglucosaminyl deacetylase